jgi:hypothetical protein
MSKGGTTTVNQKYCRYKNETVPNKHFDPVVGPKDWRKCLEMHFIFYFPLFFFTLILLSNHDLFVNVH